MQRGRGIRKSVNDASMGRALPSVAMDFESSASANSATPAPGTEATTIASELKRSKQDQETANHAAD